MIFQQTGADQLHNAVNKCASVTVAVIDSGLNFVGVIGEHLFRNSSGNIRIVGKYDANTGLPSFTKNDDPMGITVPGNNPYAITVGTVTGSQTYGDVSDDRVASFSSKGPTIEGFIKPVVVAFGKDIDVKMDESLLTKAIRIDG